MRFMLSNRAAASVLGLGIVLGIPALPAMEPRGTSACPVCDSGTGEQVRAELVDEHLPRTAAAVAAPFLVVAGVVAAVHFGVPFRKRQP